MLRQASKCKTKQRNCSIHFRVELKVPNHAGQQFLPHGEYENKSKSKMMKLLQSYCWR